MLFSLALGQSRRYNASSRERTVDLNVSRNRRILIGLLSLAALAWGYGRLRGVPEASKAVPIALPKTEIVVVQPQTRSAQLHLTGTLAAREPIVVSSELDAPAVVQVNAEVGDTVKAGQVLVRLSPRLLDAAVHRAEGGVSAARAAEKDAAQKLRRISALHAQGYVDDASFDAANAQAEAAAAQTFTARAALDAAQADRRKADILAPADGRIAERRVFAGETVRAAAPLFVLVKDGVIELHAEAAETDLARLRPGLSAVVRAAGADRAFAAHVRLIVPAVDAGTRLGTVYLALPVDAALRTGGFAEAEVALPEETLFSVPVTALTVEEHRDAVYVLNADNVIAVRPVTLSSRDGDRVQIREGLRAGDRVIRTFGPLLRPGQRVAPAER